MNVRVEIQFESPGPDDRSSMRSLARSLTDSASSVRVFAGEKPGWLVAEFTMPTEAQSAAVPKIYSEIRFWGDARMDSTIMFPKTDEEQAAARRKAQRRKARRRPPDADAKE